MRTRSQQIEQCKQARRRQQQALRSARSTKQARGMAKIQKQAGEFCLACVGHVGGTIDKNYRVRKEAGLDASTAAAVDASRPASFLTL